MNGGIVENFSHAYEVSFRSPHHCQACKDETTSSQTAQLEQAWNVQYAFPACSSTKTGMPRDTECCLEAYCWLHLKGLHWSVIHIGGASLGKRDVHNWRGKVPQTPRVAGG